MAIIAPAYWMFFYDFKIHAWIVTKICEQNFIFCKFFNRIKHL